MITASIVTYKSSLQELTQLLQVLTAEPIEVIYIVDNSPTKSLEIVRDVSPSVCYIWGQGNVGYGAAHNIAITKAMAQGSIYHLIVNPDILFQTGVVAELKNYMDTNKEVGNVLPKVYYPNGELQYLCKLLPTPLELFVRRFIPFKGMRDKINERYELKHFRYDEPLNVPCLSGCFMFIRTSALQKIGCFDENFFMYAEDFDLNRRIHKHYQTMFYPYASIIHAHQKGSYKNKKLLLFHIKSLVYYFGKWGWFFDRERRLYNKRVISVIEKYNNK